MTTAAVALAVAGTTLVATPAAADMPTGALTVSVTNEHGTPVPGADVTVVAPGVDLRSWHTDATGVIRFPALAAATYEVDAQLSTWTQTAVTSSIDVAADEASVAVVLPDVAVVRGTTLDAVAGTPVEGANVLLMSGAGGASAQTDASGHFAVGVVPGTYQLTYGAYSYLDGYYPDAADAAHASPLVVGADADADLTLRLHRNGTLAGHVTLLGKAVPNLVFSVDGYGSTWTDPHGAWSAPYVAAGRYKAHIDGAYQGTYFTTYSGNTVRAPDAVPFVVVRDKTTTANIALVATAAVSGTVVTRAGKPAPYVAVEAYNLTRTGVVEGTTDSRGRFTLRGLATGPVAVAAYGEGVSSPVKRVSAVQGSTVSTALRLSDDARLAVTIRTVGSSPTKQDVSLFDAHHAILGTFRPDSTGKISLWSLAGGTYYLTIDGSNVQKKFTLKAHQHLKLGTITRGRLVTVSGTVKTAAGKPAVGATVLVMDARRTVYKKTRTDTHGHYSVTAAVSGKYRVTVNPKSVTVDAYGTVTLTVTAGHAAKANVRLTRPGTVTGRVLNAQGKPAVGVHVLTVSGRDVRTNASGVFTLTGLHAGATYLFEADRDYVGGYKDASELVTVTAGRTTTVATIRIP